MNQKIISFIFIACFTATIQSLSLKHRIVQSIDVEIDSKDYEIDGERLAIGFQGPFQLIEHPHSYEWALFKEKYRKNYSEEEESMRFKNFLKNRERIEKHNALYAKGETTFLMEINKFGDMTLAEFSKRMNGFNKISKTRNDETPGSSASSNGINFLEPANVQLPSSVDWRKSGAVTPIKDQGHCGSCWAFSATGSLEGQHFRHNKTLVSLSEQNLIDCSKSTGNSGCDGGLMNNAFIYVKTNKGIDTERSYPYEAEDDICRYKPINSGADDVGFVNIVPKGNETSLQAAVATVGPISVAIDADHDSFMFYKSGVYFEHMCSSTLLDHGVLAVGYGTDSKTGKDFWIVKNSWGEDWGEKGYVRMSRNKHNNCGIATSASYPLVK